MSNAPTLSYSYVLLTYNQADTVAEAVESALAQECPPMEIVISDDFSIDSTFDVAEKTVEGYSGPHTVILNRNEQNLGLAGNIARAHQISSGDVIIAAAGDDASFPHRSMRIMEKFETGGPCLVCSYAQVVGPDGMKMPGNFQTAAFYSSTDLEKAARSKSLYIGATGAWHRMLYEKYGPLDPETYEDLVLGFRAALEGNIGVIEEELVKYRLGQGITSLERYHTDAKAFGSLREKAFVAKQAIMQQRIKDTEIFGLAENSPVWRILEKEAIKAALGLAFYQNRRSGFVLKSLSNPLLGLYTWHSESRKKRKMLRRLSKKPKPLHG